MFCCDIIAIAVDKASKTHSHPRIRLSGTKIKDCYTNIVNVVGGVLHKSSFLTYILEACRDRRCVNHSDGRLSLGSMHVLSFFLSRALPGACVSHTAKRDLEI